MVFSQQSKTRQDNDKTNVEPVHSYDAFHTRHAGPGVKGIIGMHRFNSQQKESCVSITWLTITGVNIAFVS